MQFFFRNCTHILTRTQAKKFDTFLIKMASKGTSLNQFKPILSLLITVGIEFSI